MIFPKARSLDTCISSSITTSSGALSVLVLVGCLFFLRKSRLFFPVFFFKFYFIDLFCHFSFSENFFFVRIFFYIDEFIRFLVYVIDSGGIFSGSR